MLGNIFSRFMGPDPHAIDPEEFEKAVKDGEVHIVDVREAHEFASGHIPKSVNMPLSRFNPNALPAGKTVVLVCQTGMRSGSAVHKLKAMGHEGVKHYAPGVLGWYRRKGVLTR